MRASRRPKKQLHEAARHLGREHPLGRRVEGADVERARVAQRDRRRARRERLVHVDEVERRERRAPPRPCARRRPAATARWPRRLNGSSSPTPSTRTPPSGSNSVSGSLARGADQPARVAHELRRARRREHEHAVTALGELRRQLGHERVDLVGVLPGVRRDLGDGEALGHRAQGKAPAARARGPPGRASLVRDRRACTCARGGRPAFCSADLRAASAALRVFACLAMNSSVASRAWSSGRCV